MTVTEVINELKKYPAEARVLCESDSCNTYYGSLTIAELDEKPVILFDPSVKYTERVPIGRAERMREQRECGKPNMNYEEAFYEVQKQNYEMAKIIGEQKCIIRSLSALYTNEGIT